MTNYFMFFVRILFHTGASMYIAIWYNSPPYPTWQKTLYIHIYMDVCVDAGVLVRPQPIEKYKHLINWSTSTCTFLCCMSPWEHFGHEHPLLNINVHISKDNKDVGRFAYKSIRIHQGRFADKTLVNSHTSKSFCLQFESATLKSICIHNLSRFAYKKVIHLRI